MTLSEFVKDKEYVGLFLIRTATLCSCTIEYTEKGKEKVLDFDVPLETLDSELMGEIINAINHEPNDTE